MRNTLLLGVWLSACSGAYAASACLEPTDSSYKCETNEYGEVDLGSCGITDEDVEGGDLASCLDAAGRDSVLDLSLTDNRFTTLPEEIFQNLTVLEELYLHDVPFTILPEDLFQGLAALQTLYLYNTSLTALPEGIFYDLGALEALSIGGNNVTSLSESMFQGLPAIRFLFLDNTALTTVPEDTFQNITTLEILTFTHSKLVVLEEGTFRGLTILEELDLGYNDLTTLPAGIFQDVTALDLLLMEGNSLECLPTNNATFVAVDTYGSECGCSVPGVTDNVCGEDTCSPGPTGYTCVTAAATTTPEAADDSSSSSSSNVPVIVGSVGAVAGAVLIGLGVMILRRRTAQNKNDVRAGLPPPASATGMHAEDTPGRANRQHHARRSAASSAVVGGANGQRRSYEQSRLPPAAGGSHQRDIAPPSYYEMVVGALGGRDGDVESGTSKSKTKGAAMGGGAFIHGGPRNSNDRHEAERSLTASISTGGVSTEERADELARFRRGRTNNDAASRSDGRKKDASRGERRRNSSPPEAGEMRKPSSDVGIGQAAMDAAQELASQSSVPGVSEAAALVAILVNLVTDSQDNSSGADARLRQCRSIVLMLERAAEVADRGGNTAGGGTRVLVEDVHDAIADVVELVKTYQSKNKLSKILMSTLFKRRQEELDAVVDRAVVRLQLGLQVQVGKDVSAVKRGMSFHKRSIDEAKSESLAEARRARRQRKLDQVEIPEDHVTITDELLGKGGFGEVYLADYNGRNAAAKVLHIADELGGGSESDTLNGQLPSRPNDGRPENAQLRAFLRELDAMIRLRSPHTVNVYGAVTSRANSMVLVMELLAGGDLRTMLKNSREPLPEEKCRQIIGDICAGMAFLHGKNTVHGDLKSANVLLDGAGRAKIGDFGTSRWAHHTHSTGLATYTTKAGQSTQMSLAWSAPEVLDAQGSTYASDVYSFGVVAWEVLSRELPWARVTHPKVVYIRVVLKALRPEIPADAPADLANAVAACWAGDPEVRPKFSDLMETMAAKGWTEQHA